MTQVQEQNIFWSQTISYNQETKLPCETKENYVFPVEFLLKVSYLDLQVNPNELNKLLIFHLNWKFVQ